MKISRLPVPTIRRLLFAGCRLRLCVAFALMLSLSIAAQAAEWLGPGAIEASRDGKSLFVACVDANQVQVVDVASGKVGATMPMPATPTGLILSPDGAKLYVTCAAPRSTVAVIDVAQKKVTGQLPAGHTATGGAISPDGKTLYVCNRFDNDVSVIDLAAGKETSRIAAKREPVGAACTPDGSAVFVINLLPLDRADSYDLAAEVTVINTSDQSTKTIRLPNGSSSVLGVAISPDGKHVYTTHILARYQMPTTQLERGWMNTNALSIIDAENCELINTVLLDDVDLGAANPTGVTTTADGSLICVAHAGTHELSVIDAAGLMAKLAAVPEKPPKDDVPGHRAYAAASQSDVPNDLAFLVGLRERIKLTGNSARDVAVIGDKAYATMFFTDNLAVAPLPEIAKPITEYKPGQLIETLAMPPGERVASIALGPEPKLTAERRGQMLFGDAALCFQHWQSCVSCHPDARVDGLNWDLLNDGLGNPKNVKSMLLAHRTPPAMSLGVRATAELAVRAGITHIQFAVRPEEDAQAIDAYLKSLEPVPSPYLVDGQLSPAAERGKQLFFQPEIGCAKCHPEPLYTDLRSHNVGSRGKYDRNDMFDTPTLIECWRTAPYMHDGHWLTIKELLTEGKHGRAAGGKVDKLTEEQIDDLVEFVLSL